MNNYYEKRKNEIREEAIDWQLDFSKDGNEWTWRDMGCYSNYFEKLGRRYGLLREFRENGIC